MLITHVVGARPNFMKAAPVVAALRRYDTVSQLLVHTGQHYDANMSGIFFDQLGLPQPDVDLGVGSASHAIQTAEIMIRLEQVLVEQRPDIVLVYGDVNSTLAAALVSVKLSIPVGHVEAGLRSFDRRMPEEINRLLTDQIADLLFTPSADGDQNLRCEGVAPDRVYLVGNVMIDSLVRLLPNAEARWDDLCTRLKLQDYGLVTLHRPSNVDDPSKLTQILNALADISEGLPLVFPMHPRTRRRMADFGLEGLSKSLGLIEPLSYLDFLTLQRRATVIITDSGGIQEESTFLGVPCLTLRENTERPITVSLGTNTLVSQDMTQLKCQVRQILRGEAKSGKIPPLWDGMAGERIAAIVVGQSGA